MSYCVGTDGCSAGWFAVVISGPRSWAFCLYDDIIQLWNELKHAQQLLIDIPIGLREDGKPGRTCDIMARKILGHPRAASVFPTPVRQTLSLTDYASASEMNHLITGKYLSIFTWHIMPKIRQIDQFLRLNPDARKKFREAHPEVLFWAFNGQKAMQHNKKKAEGYDERLACLRPLFPDTDKLVDKALNAYPRKKLAKDDILDALAAAVAGFLGKDRLTSIPDTPEFDPQGIPMEIVYHSFSPQ